MEIAIIILFIIALILDAMLISQRITLKSENYDLRDKLRDLSQEKELILKQRNDIYKDFEQFKQWVEEDFKLVKKNESCENAKQNITYFIGTPKGTTNWLYELANERYQKTNQAFAKALNEKSEKIRELERELSDTLSQLRQTNEIHTMANYTIIELKKELEAEKAKQKYFHSGANEIEQDLREQPKPKKGKNNNLSTKK